MKRNVLLKLLALLLAAFMLLGAAACAGPKENKDDEITTEAPATKEPAPADAATDGPSDGGAENGGTETEAPETEPAVTEAPATEEPAEQGTVPGTYCLLGIDGHTPTEYFDIIAEEQGMTIRELLEESGFDPDFDLNNFVTLLINEDGSGRLVNNLMDDETLDFTWADNGAELTLTDEDSDELRAAVCGGDLVLELYGSYLYFSLSDTPKQYPRVGGTYSLISIGNMTVLEWLEHMAEEEEVTLEELLEEIGLDADEIRIDIILNPDGTAVLTASGEDIEEENVYWVQAGYLVAITYNEPEEGEWPDDILLYGADMMFIVNGDRLIGIFEDDEPVYIFSK